jgi:hypothetical protein
MGNWKKFKETELPHKDKFYGKLNGCGISDNEHMCAKLVWNKFNIKIWVNIMIYILKLMFYW